MYKDIRTGVIGIGSMGKNHARVYSEISNLVGVADKDEINGKKVASEFETNWYSDYRDLIPLVDAVSIAVPTRFHSEIAIDVANSGVNLLVEKPFAHSFSESKKIISASLKKNVVLGVGHVERHNPVVKYTKKKLVEKDFGIPLSIFSKRLSPYPARISDVGVVLDLSVHDIDIMNYIFGNPPFSVYCLGGSYRGTNEDYVTIFLDYGEDRCGVCETSWLSEVKVREMTLTNQNSSVKVNLMKQTITTDTDVIKIPNEEPLKNELLDFLQSVKVNKLPLVTGEDGTTIVQIAKSALQSLESKKIIEL